MHISHLNWSIVVPRSDEGYGRLLPNSSTWRQPSPTSPGMHTASKIPDIFKISKMLAERDAVMRESSVLLASAAYDERLMKSLHQIEELTKTLQEEKELHQKKVSHFLTVILPPLSISLSLSHSSFSFLFSPHWSFTVHFRFHTVTFRSDITQS